MAAATKVVAQTMTALLTQRRYTEDSGAGAWAAESASEMAL
jgi:hypothetical protein